MHNVVHIFLLVLFLATVSAGFLGLIRPLIEAGPGLRLPGPRATVLLFLAALLAAVGDWVLHRYIM